jgi:hypothetical protein
MMFEMIQPRLDAGEPFIFPPAAFDHLPDQAKDHRVAGFQVAHVAANIGLPIAEFGNARLNLFQGLVNEGLSGSTMPRA